MAHATLPETTFRPPALFVVGSGRCGSTLLSTMLSLHPALLSVSELLSMAGGPRVLGNELISGAQYWSELSELTPDLRELLCCVKVPEIVADLAATAPDQLSSLELVALPQLSREPRRVVLELQAHMGQRGLDTPGEHLRSLLEWLCARFERRFWVERSGGSLEYVDRLTAHWPQARLLHLVRDGRDVAYSMSRHPMFRVHLARILNRDPLLPVAACLALDIPLHRFGAYWSALMLKGQRSLRSHTARGEVCVVHYEQLTANPVDELARIWRWLTGEPAADAWRRAAADLVRPVAQGWPSLPAPLRAELEAACRPGLRCVEQRSLG